MPLPDQVICGRYRLVSRLGSGGMGLVFLAETLGVGNRVAIKFLDPEPNNDDSRVARFLREARVGLEVKHPGAAQVLDLGRDDLHRLFVVFEFVEGVDLRELLKSEGRLSFVEARDIALKIAEVLHFAHEHGIVHRDIKPENVRIRRDLASSHVKVLDFGIARLVKDGGVRLTAEGSLAGTPRYMAPEQIRDAPIDGRTDIYALGLVFFEMLSGSAAYTGRNISQILLKQVQEPLPLLRRVSAELDAPLVDDFLSKACAKEPADRFQSMPEFVKALRSLEVDPARWPKPRRQPEVSTATTRDGREVGLSDTVIRANQTELELPRPALTPNPVEAHATVVVAPEVPTEPEHLPVQRRTTLPEARVVSAEVPSVVVEVPAIEPRKRPRGALVVLLLLLLSGGAAAVAWWMGLLLRQGK